MTKKKLLLIQLDEPYFLLETLLTLDHHRSALVDFETTVLTSFESLKVVHNDTTPTTLGLTIDKASVLKEEYDLSINFSLSEQSWDFHNQVNSKHKIGPYKDKLQLHVPGSWSSFLLTLKGKAPFLTFHLRDIFKNILNIKSHQKNIRRESIIKTVAFGTCNPDLFPANEQESLINEMSKSFPLLSLKDVSEIDVLEDLSGTLYIGPATLDSLKLCEAGALGLFLGSQFQGFNLLPYEEGHFYISSRGLNFESKKLFPVLESFIQRRQLPEVFPYSVYKIEHENVYGAFLKALNQSDDNYPFYLSHVVLWNYLLSLFDTNLQVIECTEKQLDLLKVNQLVLDKYLQLHRYAMASMDVITSEAKSSETSTDKIQGHMKNLQEIEQITDQISQANPFLRPFLDYYRIRRGQNDGNSLLEQSQNSFLVYSEEHQALQALNELFSVTIKKNEVNI